MAYLRTGSIALCLVLGACGDDGAVEPATDSSSGGASSSGTTVPDPDSTTVGPVVTSTDDGETTEETGFDPPEPMCGNGFVEGDEECDDANDEDGDACNNACQIPCGLQWSVLVLGPTLDSEIEGRTIEEDADGTLVIAGLLQEVTVEMDGTVLEGDDTVVVQSHMPEGGLLWEQVLGDAVGDVNIAGAALDEAGNIYVSATVDAADGGTAIRAWRLDPTDGAVVWTHDFDGAFEGETDSAFGIAVGPDGNPVVSGQSRAGDGDDDVWLRKLDAASGAEQWTQTYSGSPTGDFSTDDGGPVAIGPDGSVYVLSRIYENFSTIRGTLLRFGPDGGEPTWIYTPDIPGANQDFSLDALAVSSLGPVMSVSRVDGSDIAFWIYQLDPQGEVLWSRERADFDLEGIGDDWLVEGLMGNGDELVVLGRYLASDRQEGVSWWEPWVTRLDADAELRCQVLQQGQFEGLIPPSLLGYGLDVAPDGSALVTGEQNSADESGLWIGSFRN